MVPGRGFIYRLLLTGSCECIGRVLVDLIYTFPSIADQIKRGDVRSDGYNSNCVEDLKGKA